jgi:hypothetical protein
MQYKSNINVEIMRRFYVRNEPVLISNEDNCVNANVSPQPKYMNRENSDEKRETVLTFYTYKNADIEMGLKSDKTEVSVITQNRQLTHDQRIRI